MRVKYFPDTDTLHIELNAAPVAETRELDENTLIDVDANGHLCGMTIEHAQARADAPHFSYENAEIAGQVPH